MRQVHFKLFTFLFILIEEIEMMKKSVTRLMALVLILVLALSLAACQGGTPASSPSGSSPSGSSPSAAAPSAASPSQGGQAPAGPGKPDVIKVGFVASLTGSSAGNGLMMQQGWELAMKRLGNQLGGVPVDWILEDEASDPATAVTKTTKLIDNDKVDILIGGSNTPNGNAIAPVAIEKGVPYIMPVVAADTRTQHDFDKHIIRTGWNASQPMYIFGEYAYKELGLRTIAIVAEDTAFAYEQSGAFKIGFELAGGKITHIQYLSVNNTDFGAFVANIPQDVDAVWDGVGGGNGPTLIQEIENYGLRDKMMLIASGTPVDEAWLDACGDAGVGIISASHYSNAIGTPSMEAFVDEFTKEYGRAPAFPAETGYTSALMLDAALKYVFDNGLDYKNIDDLNEAFHSIEIAAPRGNIRLDEYNSAINNIYIRKVEKTNGKYGTYQNTPIKVYDYVDQWGNGPFTREQRLALPPYSKEWPWNAAGIY